MCGSAFTKNGTLFVGDNNFNLFRSDDYGVTFRFVNNFPVQPYPNSAVTGYVWNIFTDSRNYIFVSIPSTNRLYRSTNFGASFTQVLNTNTPKNDGFFIAMTEDSQGSLYAATYSNSVYPNNPPLLKSTNGGATWTVIHRFSAIHLHNVKFNPADSYLYINTGEYTPGYNNQECERVFRSKDLGATWSIVINRPVEMQAEGNTVYLPMLFSGRWVYLGTDQAFQPNWIDRFYDDGSSSAFTPQKVYSFPADCNFPVISAVWLNGEMIFSSTAEFYDGTSRVVASDNGVNWQIIKEVGIPQPLHHTNFLTINPMGILFGSDGPGRTFSISEKGAPQPTPTPTPTPTPSPTPTPTAPPGILLFQDGFESGNFNAWTTNSGAGTHTQTVESSNPHHGSFDAKFTAGANSEAWSQKNLGSAYPVLYFQQYIKLASLPTSGTRLYLGTIQNTNSNNNVDVFIENSGSQYYWGAYTSINGAEYYDRESAPSNPRTGVYYCVETCRDATISRTKLWVDGSLKVDASRPHIGNANNVYSGISYTSNTATVYVDCAKLSTTYIESETPQPTPTPSPTPTATPTSSPTPTPTSTPTPSPTPTPTPSPSYLFSADFESGNFNEYSGIRGAGTYTATVETVNPYRGTYDAKFTAGANSEGWAYHSISSTASTYYRQVIKLGNLPAPGTFLYLGSIQNSNSQNTVDPFIYNSNGRYYWGAVTVINGAFYWDYESSPSNPQVGTYYNVELLRDVANHKTDLWINGALKVDASRAHVGNSNFICTGVSWADSSATIYVDCVRVRASYIGVQP
jgi:hypothetical protein